MRCFVDYVGLQYCTPVVPESGYYINWVPGISIKSMDNIADAEQKSFIGVWNDIQERSAVMFEQRILNVLSKYIRTEQTKQNTQFGAFRDQTQLADFGNQYRGVRIYATLWRYKKLYIKNFIFWSQEAKTGAQFKIYDLNFGTLLHTITVDLIAGFNTVQVNYSVTNNMPFQTQIYICYDANEIKSRQTDSVVMGSDGQYAAFVSGGYVNGLSDPNTANIVYVGDTYGISINYIVECSLEAFICSNRERFKQAWVSLLSAEFMKEKLFSDRVNRYTMNMTKEKMEEMYNKYVEEYNKEIDDVLINMALPKDDCFHCNTLVQTIYARP